MFFCRSNVFDKLVRTAAFLILDVFRTPFVSVSCMSVFFVLTYLAAVYRKVASDVKIVFYLAS